MSNLRSSEFVSYASMIFARAREFGLPHTLIINKSKLKVVGWRIIGLKPANDNEAKS